MKVTVTITPRAVIWAVIAVAGIALVISFWAPFMTTRASGPSGSGSFLVTLYGWPDNSPPGGDIAYPVLHDSAGGTGTYADPVTFATDRSELPVGTKVYVPFLHRYFIMEDDCTECDEDWAGHGPDGGPRLHHIDLWVGGEGARKSKDVIRCEDDLTRNSAPVIINPPSSEPVDTTALFNSAGDACYRPSSFRLSSATSTAALSRGAPGAWPKSPRGRAGAGTAARSRQVIRPVPVVVFLIRAVRCRRLRQGERPLGFARSLAAGRPVLGSGPGRFGDREEAGAESCRSRGPGGCGGPGERLSGQAA